MAYTSVATDNFNRASLGANWTQQNAANAGNIQINASIQIEGQYSAQPTDQHATAVWAGAGTFNDDQYSLATLVTLTDAGTAYRSGVTTRATGSASTRTHYEAYVIHNGVGNKTTHLCRWVNGTRTAIANTTVAWAANDTIRLVSIGTSHKVYRNDVEIAALSSTDANISTGKPGVSSTAGIYLDNWDGGNATVDSGVVNNRGGVALSSISELNGFAKSGISAINGLTIFEILRELMRSGTGKLRRWNVRPSGILVPA